MKERLWSDQACQVPEASVTSLPQESALWEQVAYPLGNGRLGATVYGSPQVERIHFNHDSLWVGNEDNTGAYQPFGWVDLELHHSGYEAYHRELDLRRAVQTLTYRADGGVYRREYFVSHPAQGLVVHLGTDRTGGLSGTVRLSNIHEIPVVAEPGTLILRGTTAGFWYWQRQLQERERRLLAGRAYASDQNIDLEFEARLRLLNEGGSVRAAGDALVFERCDRITLLLAADTNYVNRRERGWRGDSPRDRVAARIAAAERRSYPDLLEEHVADYGSLYNRVRLDLGPSPSSLREAPTAERVRLYAEAVREGRVPEDRELEALLYQYARYLMICSSRGAGALPANLQGIWLIRRDPPWRCDYHTDVNLEMNYWFVDAANLSECFLPLAEWIHSIREVRREETRRVFGARRGWLMRSENGIFGGSTWHFQKGDSAWLCQNLWDHYAYTQDQNYLRQYAYPVMKEICEFWLDHLKELPDGTLVAPEGRSPEHGPVGVDGVSYDQQLCWDLFTNTIEASETLGVDAEFRGQLKAARERLLGPRIGRWGQLQEWMEDLDDPHDTHRHLSHLIAVYPGRQIHPSMTPGLAQAAKTSLQARGLEGPGWSLAWKACLYARLGDGATAWTCLARLLGTKVHGNLWAVHPPFQIDANFGYAAAVHEMLVQSHLDSLHVLPALPKVWSEGSVQGLRVRGGFELDLRWQDGRLVELVVRGISNRRDQCTVRYGNRIRSLEVPRGGRGLLRAGDF